MTAAHERDFYAWTQEQAAALRQIAELRLNVPGLDLENLAEEIEDMGNDTLDKIEGLMVQIIAHLLKLEFSPDPLPRNHWRGEVTAWRNTIIRRAKRSPSALDRIDINDLSRDAATELQRRYRDWAWTRELPTSCRYTRQQLLDRDFFPENTSGISDD